jgi:D-glycero-D-manno-heptose 1,7-bisphosphate phosphatase
MGVPAVFLDRDGVVIENRSAYVRQWEDVRFFERSLQALAELSGRPYKVLVVTNQAGIGRGLVSESEALRIGNLLVAEIAAHGGRIDGVYMCPHTPEDACACRKPLPGLILEAAAAHDVDLANSILIGDAVTDLQAAIAAGIPTYALVRTGRGAEQETLLRDLDLGEAGVYEDLKAALDDLLKVEG